MEVLGMIISIVVIVFAITTVRSGPTNDGNGMY